MNKIYVNIIKRLFDLLFSIIGLLLFSITYIIVRIMYLISGDYHKIIYTHERIGKNDKPFKMYKFRTMVVNSKEVLDELLKDPKIKSEWKKHHKLNNDPRITKVGKIIRKASIDELPQFINVFLGQMSLIGPRPLVRDEIDDYGKDKDKYVKVLPGITGYWACNGRSNCSPEERKELELYYVDHISLLLDIKVFFMTIIKVITKEGAK